MSVVGELELRGELLLSGEEHAWLADATSGDEVVLMKVLTRLGRERRRRYSAMEADWRHEFEMLCDNFGGLYSRFMRQQDHVADLEKRARDNRERYERIAEELEREVERLREERDEAREATKHAFGQGRRSHATEAV